MSVYIKGMEMPTSCGDCPCANGDRMRCQVEKRDFGFFEDTRPSWCPLVPVPNHGRLGDLDELFKRMFVGPDGQRYPDKDVDGWDHAYTFRGIKHEILSAPTIIPASTADKGGEG